MRPDNKLVLRTADVARAAPAAWDQFISEFRKYTNERRDALVAAPREVVQLAQGHAQLSDALLELFENAIKAADKIDQRQRSPHPARAARPHAPLGEL